MPTASPSPPILLLPPSAGERLARYTAPSTRSSLPPVPSPLLPSSGCPTQTLTLRIASTQALIDAVTTALPSPPLPPLLPSLYIPPPVDLDPAEAVPEIAPTTLGEVSTRVVELAELHERDTQELYALLEDAQDGRTCISQHNIRYTRLALRYSRLRWKSFEILTGDAELLALQGQQRTRQPGPDARILDHQDASRDADSHI
ncbi:hypothetical protein Tco_0810797 [Tanacetum coccineum]